ncbi:2,4-dihydroxyhept-2-ene-1,7-dioic acid aldolase [Jannaschia pagri]|uniref:2,4-dihydroxyhept-2-ene-1,7-dioic acid aldolase n=1 Tax=Jannaschia pagri TaxID=2829797 RepID=A0ABQ4NP74_9RHOB|nr:MULTISPECIES: aldolase/citrate lyase family protein [unclassified Jannaschia]GIT92381.1 2,4-dihydroxyhept-2-ene-1,7-dioic acid aldolase [Jannaschia sp. AI_61]GIT96216.1 2,4-dihydroxyhept-2-ene-1,7-dioic acid aldolase [Jannaschia sp. AI_62]
MNALKDRLLAQHTLWGIWQNLPGPEAAEIARNADFDWLVIDGEHGAWDPSDIRARLIAAPEAVVRVPVAEDWVIKQTLDLGAKTVLIPMVNTPEQATAAVAACRYPPEGRRGVGAMVARAGRWGRDADYLERANGEVSVWVQAESRLALENLEAICAVPGVDCVFLGPADLAWDMGTRPDAPEVIALLEQAIERIAATGTAPGIFGAEPHRWQGAGARVICLGSDAMVLTAGLAAL